MKFRGEAAWQIPFTYVRAHAALARKWEGGAGRDRQERARTHPRVYVPTHAGEFTRGINYVRTVKANIITDVLGFLTGHSP